MQSVADVCEHWQLCPSAGRPGSIKDLAVVLTVMYFNLLLC